MGLLDKIRKRQDDSALNAFAARCMEELQAKQDALMSAHRLQSYDRCWFDQEAKTIRFMQGEAAGPVFQVVIIGSWSEKASTWMWGWANPSLPRAARIDSLQIRDLASGSGFSTFNEQALRADELKAQELAAMAVHYLGAIGMHRVPSGELFTYLAFT